MRNTFIFNEEHSNQKTKNKKKNVQVLSQAGNCLIVLNSQL